VNTVVHRFNKDESMYGFIELAKPLRWKIFKVLPIENQNGDSFDNYKISDEEFALYLKRNTTEITEKIMVPEDNDAMSESYLMIDPAGRFFDNANGSYRYTQSIIDVGVNAALKKTAFDFQKYVTRGGMYNW
jgi:radical S-adenosyl methionine domain-containing protein 2